MVNFLTIINYQAIRSLFSLTYLQIIHCNAPMTISIALV